MPTGILVPNDLAGVPDFARRAEALGYDRVWAAELWGRDAFVSLTASAETTDEIGLGTAIANVYGRSPATLAQSAATLDQVSDGRAAVGLGTSTEKAVEDLHGRPFEQPARRLHETCELVGEFLAEEGRVDYDGKLFDVADFPALDAEVPVYAAALGSATRRAVGRTADGWIPHNIPFQELPEAFETVAGAAEDAGRDPGAIKVAPYVPAAVSDDPAEARAQIRRHIAYYVGSGEGYRRAVAATFPDADDVASAWRDGDRDAAKEAVTEEMIEALGVAGTPETARSQLQAIHDIDVIDEPMIVIPGGTDEAVADRTIETLAP
jgi:5,10-methylenetetrahydromethanopterin reductase